MNSKRVLEWFKNVHYDNEGQMLFSEDSFGIHGLQLIANVRGWGSIQHLFEDQKEAAAFQDKVGEFIAEAINEKVKRELKDHGNKSE